MRRLSLILLAFLALASMPAAAVTISTSQNLGTVPATSGSGLLGYYYEFSTSNNIGNLATANQLISSSGGPTATFTTTQVCFPDCAGNSISDSSTMTQFLNGHASNFSYTSANHPTSIDHSAIVLNGFIAITQTGTYNFNLGSDDGAQLTIGNQVVIGDGVLHSFAISSGSATFTTAGLYAITIQYYENSGYTSLEFWGSDSSGNCTLGRCNNTAANNPFYLTVPGSTAVPEPGAVTTFLGGLAAAAWVRRKSRRAI